MQVEVDHEAGEAVGAPPGAFVFRAPDRGRVTLLDGLPELLRQKTTCFMAAEVIRHAGPGSSGFCYESEMAAKARQRLRARATPDSGSEPTGGFDMRILAATFMTRPSAVMAREALDRSFGTAVRIAVLGGTGDDTGAEDEGPEDTDAQRPEMVLAGRFTDDVIAAVRRAILELGGTVVVDVDEDRTH